MQTTITKFLILTIILTAALSVNYLFAAWVGPTQAPPGGNTSAPIHVGSTDQIKDGGLSLNSLAVFGSGYFQGSIQVGDSGANPQAGEIRWTGSDLEVWGVGGEWKSLTVGGGSCSSGQDLVDFGSTSICLAGGATVSANCSDTQISTYSYTLSVSIRAQYINGQIQTRVSGSFPWFYPNSCDSGWVNGLSASCSYNGYKTTLSVSAQTSSSGISGSGTGNGWRSRRGDGVTFTGCSTMTGTW